MSTASTISAVDVCEHCGRKLERYSFEVLGKKVTFLDTCDCAGATAERDPMRYNRDTEQSRRESRYERAGIGSMYRTADASCHDYVRAVESGRNVYIHGPNGSGKSMLAASIAKKLCDAYVDVLFVNACHAVKTLQAAMDGKETDIYERMCSVPVLVIDDIGKGNPTEWDASTWYSVMEARYAEALPTVVTTNYSGSELIVRLTAKGDDSTAKAILSRLRGGAVVVKLDGTDRRVAS